MSVLFFVTIMTTPFSLLTHIKKPIFFSLSSAKKSKTSFSFSTFLHSRHPPPLPSCRRQIPDVVLPQFLSFSLLGLISHCVRWGRRREHRRVEGQRKELSSGTPGQDGGVGQPHSTPPGSAANHTINF